LPSESGYLFGSPWNMKMETVIYCFLFVILYSSVH
jgi:hypothetical protein